MRSLLAGAFSPTRAIVQVPLRFTMNKVFEIVAILFCFELAIFLAIVPWSGLWESNLLFAYAPAVRPIMLHALVRIGVTGLGLLNFLIGVSEARRFLHLRLR